MQQPTDKALLRRICRPAACLLAGAVLLSVGTAFAQEHASKSADLFMQMATVFQHPRCMNCHTNTAFPKQGDGRHRHTMNIARGPNGHGAAGLHCSTCHQAVNQPASGVPGAPDWHLAPLRMAWDGLTPGEICRALFDAAHGGMKPDQLVAHFNSAFVRWAWSPGVDAHGRARTVPPISHERLIEITNQWVASGAACPQP